MILIADSGSTKTEWCVALDGKSLRRILTPGINPFYQSEEEIANELSASLLPQLKDEAFTAIYFYGAGCAFSKQNKLLEGILSRLLNAPAKAGSDLLGAARALCGDQRGIACILGTGSNSCLYNGTEIVNNVSPLGFILGDEGSGAVLGKLLVGDCLKNQFPPHLTKQFMKEYELTPATLLERVYRTPFPNRYLAGLSRFLGDHLEEPAVHDLIYASFRSFFIRNVAQYPGYGECPIHFIGSVAYYYKEILHEVAQSLGLEIGIVTQSPMAGLLAYHTTKKETTPWHSKK
ncbi:MAG: ATPase [Tannerellaceae bacterium]